MFTAILIFWNNLKLQTKIIIVLISIMILGSLSFYVYYKIKLNKSQVEIEKIETQRAQEIQKDIEKLNQETNSILSNANKLEEQTNTIINKDSNTYSKDSKEVENKFCTKMCSLGILDSSCINWAKQRGKICN